MVFPSTTGVSVRVLRLVFVPGCGGPHEFVNSVSFSHFSLLSFLQTPLALFLIYYLFAQSAPSPPLLFTCCLCFPTSSSYSSSPLFLFSSLSLPLSFSSFSPPSFQSLCLPSAPCLEGPMGALWFVCWKAYQHHRRHHWNLSLFSLLALAPFFFFPLPSPLSFSSLFFPPLFLMWKF